MGTCFRNKKSMWSKSKEMRKSGSSVEVRHIVTARNSKICRSGPKSCSYHQENAWWRFDVIATANNIRSWPYSDAASQASNATGVPKNRKMTSKQLQRTLECHNIKVSASCVRRHRINKNAMHWQPGGTVPDPAGENSTDAFTVDGDGPSWHIVCWHSPP